MTKPNKVPLSGNHNTKCHGMSSYDLQANLDAEWKLTRTRLWLSWVYKKGVLPPPFNLLYLFLPFLWVIKRLVEACCSKRVLVSKVVDIKTPYKDNNPRWFTRMTLNSGFSTIGREPRYSLLHLHLFQAVGV